MKTPIHSYPIQRVEQKDICAILPHGGLHSLNRAADILFSTKKISLTLLLLYLLVPQAWSQQTFSRTYGRERFTRVQAALETQEGNMALLGVTDAAKSPRSGVNLDIWIMSTDAEGNPQWTKRLRSPLQEQAYDMLETRDGNLVILGAGEHPETGYAQALVFQLNQFGELMWFNRFGGEKEGGDRLFDIAQTRDGGYVLTGFTHSNTDSLEQENIWLLRLDAAGNMRWQESLGGVGQERGLAVREGLDGRIVIGGSVQRQTANGTDMMVVCTDRKGKSEWTFTLPARRDGRVLDLAENEEGEWLCVGQSISLAGEHDDAYVWKLSQQGQLIWSQAFGEKGTEGFHKIITNAEGGYTLLGKQNLEDSLESPFDIWLMGMDEGGQQTWESHTSGEATDLGYSLFPLQNGGYLVGGMTRNAADAMGTVGYLLRTDRRGRFGIGASGVLIEETGEDLPEAEPLATREDRPNLWVLSIGVSNFWELNWNLRFAASDAYTFSQQTQEAPATLYSEIHTRTLTDTLATRENILAGLDWLASAARPEDVVMVYLSTHGVMDLGGQVHFLPYDFRTNRWNETALDMYALQSGMSAIEGKKILMLDACHSAATGSNLFNTPQALQLNQSLVNGLSIDPSLTLLTAANGAEYAYEDQRWGQSAFAKALLEAWKGAADYDADRIISLYELNFYLLQRVKDLTLDQQHPSMPINLFGDIPLLPVSP